MHIHSVYICIIKQKLFIRYSRPDSSDLVISKEKFIFSFSFEKLTQFVVVLLHFFIACYPVIFIKYSYMIIMPDCLIYRMLLIQTIFCCCCCLPFRFLFGSDESGHWLAFGFFDLICFFIFLSLFIHWIYVTFVTRDGLSCVPKWWFVTYIYCLVLLRWIVCCGKCGTKKMRMLFAVAEREQWCSPPSPFRQMSEKHSK